MVDLLIQCCFVAMHNDVFSDCGNFFKNNFLGWWVAHCLVDIAMLFHLLGESKCNILLWWSSPFFSGGGDGGGGWWWLWRGDSYGGGGGGGDGDGDVT